MPTIEIPEYGDVEGVKKALEANSETVRQGRAMLKRALATKRAIQAMCSHKMVSDGDARMPTDSCEYCGYSPGGRMQITVYE